MFTKFAVIPSGEVVMQRKNKWRTFAGALLVAAIVAQSARATPYYWDNNGTSDGFGTAGGTWTDPTLSQWSTDSTGVTAPGASVTTTTSDDVWFGTDALGLASGTITVSGNVYVHNITFGSASGAIALSGGTSITLGGTTPTITVNNASNTINSVIAGTAGLNKLGTGTLTLTNNNSYSGGTTVQAGILQIGDGTNSTAAVSGTTTLSGGSLAYNYNAANFIVNGAITLTAAATISKLNATVQQNFLPGTLNGGGQTLNIDVDTTGGTKPLYFNQTAGTALGQVNILHGAVGEALNLGKPLSGAAMSVSNGAQFRTFSTGTVNNNITLNGGTGPDGNGALWNEGSGTADYTGTITLANSTDSSIGTSGGNITISGQVTGGGSLTKIGANTLTLSGALANTHLGTTTVNAGELALSKTAGVNAIGGALTIGDGTGGANADVVKLLAANQIPDAASVTINSSGLLNLNGNNETIDGLSGSGNVDGTSGAPILTVGSNGGTATFSGVIKNTTGTLALTKLGAGTLTLSGANTYSGDTTISAGTLKLGAANVIPDGAGKGNVVMTPSSGTATFDLGGFSEGINGLSSSGAGSSVVDNTNGAGTLTVGNNNATSSFGGVIQNTGGTLALTKTGSGTLTLSGANTYGGKTTVSGGTLTLSGSLNTTGQIDVSAAAGATLNVSGSLTTTSSAGARAIRLGTTTNQTGTMNLSGSGSLTTPGLYIGEDGGGNGLFTQSGGTTAVGASNVWLSGNTSTLSVSGGSFTVNSGNGIAYLATGTGSPTSTSTLNVNGTGSMTLGTLSFGVSNRNYTSATVNLGNGSAGGSLQVNSIAFGGGTGTSTLNFNGGTLLANATFSSPTQIATVVQSGGANISVADTKTFTIPTALTDGGGGGGLTKTGTGTLTLSGASANTYAGMTTVNAGELALSKAAGINAIGGALTIGDGTGGANADVVKLLAANQIPDTASVTVNSSGLLNLNGHSETIDGLSGSGNVDGTSGMPTLTVGSNGGTSTFSGTIKNSAGTLALTKLGTGTLTLSGSNSYSGGTTFGLANGSAAGTVMIQDSSALGTGAINFQAGGTLDLNANGLALTGNVNVYNRTDTTARTIRLDLAGSNAGTLSGQIDIRLDQANKFVVDVGTDDILTLSGNIITDATATGGAGLTKTGAGTLTLTGNNTYTGNTTVLDGILRVDGSHTTSDAYTVRNGGMLSGSGAITAPTVTVEAGGILGGTATITANVTIDAGGMLAPGNSPGITTIIGDLTENGILAFELGEWSADNNPLTYDQLIVDGDLFLGATSVLTASNYGGWDRGQWYPIIQYTGSLTGEFGSWSTSIIGINYGTGSNDWIYIMIPEPSTAILAGLGLAGLTLRRRRPGACGSRA